MAACAAAITNGVKHECPPLTNYTPDFTAEVLREKNAATTNGDAWPKMINDYGRLRAECRALNSK